MFESHFEYPLQSPTALFLWGSINSLTSMHVDPCNWTAVSWLISGRKEWKLVSPQLAPNDLVKQRSLVDSFPLPCQHLSGNVEGEHMKRWDEVAITVIQEEGDVLIIPSGWFHYVTNLEESIAVSTSVMNEANYREVLVELARADIFGGIPTLSADEPPSSIVNKFLSQVRKSTIQKSEKTWKKLRP